MTILITQDVTLWIRVSFPLCMIPMAKRCVLLSDPNIDELNEKKSLYVCMYVQFDTMFTIATNDPLQ